MCYQERETQISFCWSNRVNAAGIWLIFQKGSFDIFIYFILPKLNVNSKNIYCINSQYQNLCFNSNSTDTKKILIHENVLLKFAWVLPTINDLLLYHIHINVTNNAYWSCAEQQLIWARKDLNFEKWIISDHHVRCKV